MASAFEPAEEFEDRWKDCTVIFGNDELNTVILLPDQQILVETEDQLIYFRDEDAVISEDEVMQYHVLARCQHLTCDPTKKPRNKANGEDMNDNEALILSISNGKSVYIGQSMHMDGHAIASATNEDKHSAAFDFKGLNLKSEQQKIITGSGTIPHFVVSSKFNLKKAKQLVHAKSLKSFYRQEYELRGYMNIEECRIKPGDSLNGAYRFPNLSPGERNQPLEEIVSHADIVPDVFQFKVPLTVTLEYPEELDETLRIFALEHTEDILPRNMLRLPSTISATSTTTYYHLLPPTTTYYHLLPPTTSTTI
ncbi:hypothetical protein T069G_08781 [Trichoderma breve]|uniref:Uncharacterized protein n=1 Tax=Trichoderma breve TaxID=2034170 RepID=A0A9W9E4I2_9HYPO|nr:hypothetical protein T069G_08781 [Trichoderma breve]KAJ4857884.1 hypothetical protein T069G_08781 [Trichoderma breve]